MESGLGTAVGELTSSGLRPLPLLLSGHMEPFIIEDVVLFRLSVSSGSAGGGAGVSSGAVKVVSGIWYVCRTALALAMLAPVLFGWYSAGYGSVPGSGCAVDDVARVSDSGCGRGGSSGLGDGLGLGGGSGDGVRRRDRRGEGCKVDSGI